MGNLIDLPRWHGPLSTFVPGQSVFPLLLPIPQPRIKCGIVNSQAPILPHFDLYLCNESYWDSSPSRHSYKWTMWAELDVIDFATDDDIVICYLIWNIQEYYGEVSYHLSRTHSSPRGCCQYELKPQTSPGQEPLPFPCLFKVQMISKI